MEVDEFKAQFSAMGIMKSAVVKQFRWRYDINLNSVCKFVSLLLPPKTCHIYFLGFFSHANPLWEALASESLLQLLRDSLERKNLWPADVFHLLDQEKQGYLLQATPAHGAFRGVFFRGDNLM